MRALVKDTEAVQTVHRFGNDEGLNCVFSHAEYLPNQVPKWGISSLLGDGVKTPEENHCHRTAGQHYADLAEETDG